jgi:hypothetical protein
MQNIALAISAYQPRVIRHHARKLCAPDILVQNRLDSGFNLIDNEFSTQIITQTNSTHGTSPFVLAKQI